MQAPRTLSRTTVPRADTSTARPPAAPRRRLLSLALHSLAGVALLPLAGCQTPAAPTDARPGDTLSAAQRQGLHQLGFQRTDEGWQLNLAMSLLFDFDSDQLHAAQRLELQRMGQTLATLGITGLRVEGHTDSVGRADYNQRLSLRRADAVAQALQAPGTPLRGIQVRGLGMARPIADNNSESGRAQNRRVALIVAG